MSADRLNTYIQLPHRLAWQPDLQVVYQDDHTLATYVRLYMLADAAWPTPAALPRDLDQDTIDCLVACGLVALGPRSIYTIPGLAERRQAAVGRAQKGAKCRWDSEHPESPDASSNAASNATSNAQIVPTQTQTHTETKTEGEIPESGGSALDLAVELHRRPKGGLTALDDLGERARVWNAAHPNDPVAVPESSEGVR